MSAATYRSSPESHLFLSARVLTSWETVQHLLPLKVLGH